MSNKHYENIKIKLEEKLSDFTIREIRVKNDSELIPGYQEAGIIIDYFNSKKIENKKISIVKWVECEYNGDWEIYSFGDLFFDVERYSNEDDMINAIVKHFQKMRGDQ